MNRLTMVGLLIAIGGCGGGGGSCVVESSTGNEGWETCYDDYTSDECDDKSDDLDVDVDHASSDCDGRGFTVQCSGEYGYRLPSYGC